MLGVIYALNLAYSRDLKYYYEFILAYPRDVRYYYEFIQKVLMQMEGERLSLKVLSLKNKINVSMCVCVCVCVGSPGGGLAGGLRHFSGKNPHRRERRARNTQLRAELPQLHHLRLHTHHRPHGKEI